MLTEQHVAYLAPRAHADYKATLTSAWGWQTLTHYGITKTPQRLAGFLGNVLHETGLLSVRRESLAYKSPARLRAVWPSRFKNKSDAELLSLCNNEPALASSVYSGRMGNRRGTSDAFDFRGAGWLQVTGRDDFIKYGKMAGVDFIADPSKIDDANVMLIVACAEWQQAGCNELIDHGNFDGASAKINTGSAAKVAACVGLDDRRKCYARALGMLTGQPSIMDPPAALVVGMDPDGDTVPGQLEHWSEHDQDAADDALMADDEAQDAAQDAELARA
jgi:putative chitinase